MVSANDKGWNMSFIQIKFVLPLWLSKTFISTIAYISIIFKYHEQLLFNGKSITLIIATFQLIELIFEQF
jgi:hypothetical protein